jgi:hypothetical protein
MNLDLVVGGSALIATYAIADRWAGSGWAFRRGLRGRPIYYALPLLMLPGLVFLPLVWLGLAWAVWRSAFGWWGVMDPQDWKQCLKLFARHMLCAPLIGVAFIQGCNVSPGAALAAVMAFSAVAVALAYVIITGGQRRSPAVDGVPLCEILRGAAFGLIVTLTLVAK